MKLAGSKPAAMNPFAAAPAKAELYLRLGKAWDELWKAADELHRFGDSVYLEALRGLGGTLNPPAEVAATPRGRPLRSTSLMAQTLRVISEKPGIRVPEIADALQRSGFPLPRNATNRIRSGLHSLTKRGKVIREDGAYRPVEGANGSSVGVR